jgi:COP9 signalosome complex subunit 1
MGNEDLGKHLENIGDLDGAQEAYARMRPDVSTPKQVVDVHKHLVSVCIQRRDWGMVLVNCAKMLGHQSPEEDKTLQPYVAITKGIADIGQEKYLEAANYFLDADSSIPHTTWNEIASPNDAAVYGGLLALAYMDRRTNPTSGEP